MVSSIGLQLMLLNLLISFFLYYLSLMDLLFYHGWQIHLHWIGKFKVFKHICSCFIFFPLEAIERRNVPKLRLLTLFTALVIVIIHGEMNCKWSWSPFLCKCFFCLLLWCCYQCCCWVWISSMNLVSRCCYSWALWNTIFLEYCWNATIL
jgi:hypothetical protein